MYKSFTAKNFRCFSDLTIEPLERVNLIAGKNNVGKTALLEALWIHQGGNNPRLGITIDEMRGLRHFSVDEFLWDLFREFEPDKEIELSSCDEDGNVRTTRITQQEPRTSRILRKNQEKVIPMRETSSQIDEAVSPEIMFTYIDESGEEYKSRIYVTEDGVKLNQSSKPKKPDGIILPAQGRTNPQTNAERLGNLTVKKKQKDIVKILQYIEPRLKSLEIVPISNISIIHGDIGLDRLIPLPLLGGSMDRLLSYALAIVSAEEGTVLIDEVENGFHYTVISAAWKAVAEIARQYDVQLFTTTHSERCIRSAHQAFVEDGKYDFRFHRLDRIEDSICTVSYDQKTLAAALEGELEVR